MNYHSATKEEIEANNKKRALASKKRYQKHREAILKKSADETAARKAENLALQTPEILALKKATASDKQRVRWLRWKEKNPESFAASKIGRNKRFRDAHPGYEAERKYGLTLEQKASRIKKQKGLCAICLLPKKLCIDHDHATNFVRGLLCRGCNASIGQLGDTVARLKAALRYLQNYSPRAEWPRVMLDIAMAAASRSRDNSTRVGAVVCSEDWRVLSTGYNGPPAGSPDSLPMSGPEKHAWVIHAEINAISQAVATLGDNNLAGCRLFSTHRPCENCLRLASHHGIKELSYDLDELSEEQTIAAVNVALMLGLRVISEGEFR